MKAARPPQPIDWPRKGESKLRRILKTAQEFAGLKLLCRSSAVWKVELQVIGSPAMTRLNRAYRGKNRPTDVLSFPAPEIFRKTQGLLGDLVICLPVLKAQAKDLGHSADRELEVLLVHGVLHLLGLDHELGAREAEKMARWEKKLLEAAFSGRTQPGLIRRASP